MYGRETLARDDERRPRRFPDKLIDRLLSDPVAKPLSGLPIILAPLRGRACLHGALRPGDSIVGSISAKQKALSRSRCGLAHLNPRPWVGPRGMLWQVMSSGRRGSMLSRAPIRDLLACYCWPLGALGHLAAGSLVTSCPLKRRFLCPDALYLQRALFCCLLRGWRGCLPYIPSASSDSRHSPKAARADRRIADELFLYAFGEKCRGPSGRRLAARVRRF